MKKSVFNCATGETELVDMTPEEEAALTAQWSTAPAKAQPSQADRLAALEKIIAENAAAGKLTIAATKE